MIIISYEQINTNEDKSNFTYSAVNLYNSIPIDLNRINDKNTLKRNLEIHFSKNYGKLIIGSKQYCYLFLNILPYKNKII